MDDRHRLTECPALLGRPTDQRSQFLRPIGSQVPHLTATLHAAARRMRPAAINATVHRTAALRVLEKYQRRHCPNATQLNKAPPCGGPGAFIQQLGSSLNTHV